MKTTSVSIGKTINMGNYESLRVEVRVDRDLSNPRETRDQMSSKCLMELNYQIKLAKKSFYKI